MRFTAITIVAMICLSASLFSSHSIGFSQDPPAEKPVVPVVDNSEAPADSTQSVLAESVGLFGGLQLYNTYLNMGILADSMAEGLYEAANVYQLLGSVVNPLENVEKQFDKLIKLKLSKEDIAALKQMKKIAGLLRKQGKELELFWEKGLPENGKNYEMARQAAWKELNALLELEPKSIEKLPTPRVTTSPKP